VDGRERPDTSDEFVAEVSDVRPRPDAASTPPTRSPLAPRLTPRRWLIRLAGILSAGLALAVVLSSVSAVRDGAAGLASQLVPPPTPTLAPWSDLFYLLPNPPGVVVSLDGHALVRLPPPGDPHPLRLAPGHHVFAWRSRIFPFLPLQCSVSVPLMRAPLPQQPARPDACPLLWAWQLPAPVRYAPGTVIALHATRATLPADASGQLATAVQGALDASRSTALVQPGERYRFGPFEPMAMVVTQPLRAMLSYGALFQYSDLCVPDESASPAFPCRFPGQDCDQLCTLAHPPSAVADGPGQWVAAALVSSTWDYTTLGGHLVAGNIGDLPDVQLILLRISWNNATWHVTPLLGHTAGLPAADDLVCDPARTWLEQNGRWAFMLADGHPGTAQFVSDRTPIDGCLVVLDPHPGTDVPAVFLERFGVLLAVNAAANGPGANLPLADSAEQSLAHRLAAQAQFTF
jgi:hypothetical protein